MNLSSLSAEQLFFYPLALLTFLGAVGVVAARNPLYGVLSLVCSFFFLSATYILLAAHFVGILQVIVYAGAIMVLFLFVIMLLALTDADLGRRSTWGKVVGAVFALGILGAAIKGFTSSSGSSLVLWLQLAPQKLSEDFGTVAAVGRILFTDYLLPFEAVSALLLVAIVGSVVVAKGRL